MSEDIRGGDKALLLRERESGQEIEFYREMLTDPPYFEVSVFENSTTEDALSLDLTDEQAKALLNYLQRHLGGD